MRTVVPCNENRFFPVGVDSQGVPCELYRVWVCSVLKRLFNFGIEIVAANDYKMPIENFWQNMVKYHKSQSKGGYGVVGYGVKD